MKIYKQQKVNPKQNNRLGLDCSALASIYMTVSITGPLYHWYHHICRES